MVVQTRSGPGIVPAAELAVEIAMDRRPWGPRLPLHSKPRLAAVVLVAVAAIEPEAAEVVSLQQPVLQVPGLPRRVGLELVVWRLPVASKSTFGRWEYGHQLPSVARQ